MIIVGGKIMSNELNYKKSIENLEDVLKYLENLADTEKVSNDEIDFVWDELSDSMYMFKICRNELCDWCMAHKDNACNDCKWRNYDI